MDDIGATPQLSSLVEQVRARRSVDRLEEISADNQKRAIFAPTRIHILLTAMTETAYCTVQVTFVKPDEPPKGNVTSTVVVQTLDDVQLLSGGA